MAGAKPKVSRKNRINSKLAVIFGENVKHERERLGKTQDELGQNIGSSGTYIGFIERAQVSVSIIKIEKLCERFDRDICYMFKRH